MDESSRGWGRFLARDRISGVDGFREVAFAGERNLFRRVVVGFLDKAICKACSWLVLNYFGGGFRAGGGRRCGEVLYRCRGNSGEFFRNFFRDFWVK